MQLLTLLVLFLLSLLHHNDARSLTAKQIRALRILEEMFSEEQGKPAHKCLITFDIFAVKSQLANLLLKVKQKLS